MTVHTGTGEHKVRVEIANTAVTRTRGLMYRNKLDQDAGMLFVFPREETLQFWMKNTPLPLDMIFIGSDFKVVGIVENAKPFSTTGRGVKEPSRYVLEVNGGYSAKHGLKPGDRVEFHNVPPSAD